jgi:hypothetical protein
MPFGGIFALSDFSGIDRRETDAMDARETDARETGAMDARETDDDTELEDEEEGERDDLRAEKEEEEEETPQQQQEQSKKLIVVKVQDSFDLRTQIVMDLFIVAMAITPFSLEGAALFALCHHLFSYFFCRQANYYTTATN